MYEVVVEVVLERKRACI